MGICNLGMLFDEKNVKDGIVIWNVREKLVSKRFEFDRGHPYSMRMPLRNTICVRMKNGTQADKIRVCFKTSDSDTVYSEIFDIEPQSDCETYFFNLSESGAKGYLREFSFESLNDAEGIAEIYDVSFEREKPFCRYAGEILSCIADSENVTVKGTLKDEFKDAVITVYETGMANWRHDFGKMKKLAEMKAGGNDFTVSFGLKNGNMTRLSSHFFAKANGTLISDWFTVENFEDFSENPYKFDVPAKLAVSVLEFGAKGDGYSNDTSAIQDAINTVGALGGGIVTVPGDDSFHGRRYVMTSVKMRSNVELRIEKNAILWQSPREEDYTYEVAYGHDVCIPGVNWTHAGLCHNFPFIWGRDIDHFKITGKGTIRMNDAGSECPDGTDGGLVWIGCQYKIHLIALSFQNCHDFELSGITILRNNCYHLQMLGCSRVYLADVMFYEVTCASGDGFSCDMGTHDVKISRCFARTNDDVVVLGTSYNEPRGLIWWSSTPDRDNSIHDIEVCHSDLLGGHGICFITWGTDNPDLSRQEIYNINVYDCVLDGGWSIGSWCDNPYYGKMPFDNTETDDYSPVRDIRIVDNIYNSITTIWPLKITSFITDSDIQAADQFEYGDFERPLGKTRWIAGLSNWSVRGDRQNVTFETAPDGNHFASVKGETYLYQGLCPSGKTAFSIDVKGFAAVRIEDSYSGELIAEKTVHSSEFETCTLEFGTLPGKMYNFGVFVTSSASIDNAVLL